MSIVFPLCDVKGDQVVSHGGQVYSAEADAEECGKLARSWEGYVGASPIERRCIFAIVISTTPSDLEQYRGVFSRMDLDGDGCLSYSEMARSFKGINSRMDPAALFKAADLDLNGLLDFQEFVAACLHDHLSPFDDWLAEQTFAALDTDQDGYLHARDVLRAFDELPTGLPLNRNFRLDEWTSCLYSHGCSKSRSKCQAAITPRHKSSFDQPHTRCGLGASLFVQTLFGGCYRQEVEAPGQDFRDDTVFVFDDERDEPPVVLQQTYSQGDLHLNNPTAQHDVQNARSLIGMQHLDTANAQPSDLYMEDMLSPSRSRAQNGGRTRLQSQAPTPLHSVVQVALHNRGSSPAHSRVQSPGQSRVQSRSHSPAQSQVQSPLYTPVHSPPTSPQLRNRAKWDPYGAASKSAPVSRFRTASWDFDEQSSRFGSELGDCPGSPGLSSAPYRPVAAH